MRPLPEHRTGIDLREAQPPGELTRHSLREEFLRQVKKPPKNDPYIRAFSAAFDAVYDEPVIADLVQWFLYIRQRKAPMLPWHAHNHLLRAFQVPLIKREEELGYPQNFSRAENWVPHILDIANSRDIGFETNLWVHDVQSNVSGRYRSMAMILDVLENRFPREHGKQVVKALDVACSLHRGYKHVASSIPFSPVIQAVNADLPTVNRSIQNRVRFVDSLGVDLKSLNDENTRLWAEACSMYPSERLDPSLVATYQALDALEIPGLDFEDADFVETGPEGRWDVKGRMHPSRVHSYDVVTLYTFLYQLGAEQHHQALIHAMQAVKQDGLIIVQDFMDTEPYNQFAMSFRGASEEWSYGTYALDMRQLDKGLQPLFRWNNGRCEKLELRLDRQDPSLDLQSQIFSKLAA